MRYDTKRDTPGARAARFFSPKSDRIPAKAWIGAAAFVAVLWAMLVIGSEVGW